jgi:two-component system chemotaxis response regulator CheY
MNVSAGIQKNPTLNNRCCVFLKDWTQLRVLIVDDSDTTRRILRTVARSRAWTVCGEAHNGQSGVEKFRELKPEVVLLDLAMPDMNGIEVAQEMSAMNPKVPLILFTILDIEGLEPKARDAGIRTVVPKTEIWRLIQSVEDAVQGRGN